MLLVPVEQKNAYDHIVRTGRAKGSSFRTFIFTALDVDALCAARILERRLKRDGVSHRITPVTSWTDLEQYASQDEFHRASLGTIVCINLGSTVDIVEELRAMGFNLTRETMIHVIDSHRPISLNNAFQETVAGWGLKRNKEEMDAGVSDQEPSVAVWCADEQEHSQVKALWGAMRLLSEEFEESDSEEDLDSDEEAEARIKRRRSLREERKAASEDILEYEQDGTYLGLASSFLLLGADLPHQSHDPVGLWYAIVGLTYQYLWGFMDTRTYGLYSRAFAQAVTLTQQQQGVAFDDPGETLLRRNGGKLSSDDKSMHTSVEPRLTLIRQWSLIDSMVYSPYVAAQMRLWSESGRRQLLQLLARKGLPLQQVSSKFIHMDSEFKSTLYDRVVSEKDAYDMHDLVYNSFVRRDGSNGDIAASDVVQAAASALEADPLVTSVDEDTQSNTLALLLRPGNLFQGSRALNFSKRDARSRRPPDVEEDDNAEASSRQAAESVSRSAQQFWRAYDCLDENTTRLRAQFPVAKQLQRAVMEEGTFLFETNGISSVNSISIVKIEEGPHVGTFANPGSLYRFATWCIDAIRQVRMSLHLDSDVVKKPIPVLVACACGSDYLVLGAVGPRGFGNVKKNNFHRAFSAADDAVEGVRRDYFDPNIALVPALVLHQFLGVVQRVFRRLN